ncbi:MAG: hypothetical protein K0S45_1119 [Nitrospira sp.]|jgi:hypothetical protein|nr:hypothetical protein [Nitrospira sp.]
MDGEALREGSTYDRVGTQGFLVNDCRPLFSPSIVFWLLH